MDTRKDRGDFYPGGETGGSAPAPQQSDKVDRVNLGEVGESYTLKDVKQKVNQIVRVIAPAAVGLMLIIAGAIGIGAAGLSPHTLRAATAPLEEIPNTSPVVTNEEDSVALATLATATNALQSSTAAAMSELRSDINTASNNLATAIGEAIASESNRVEATYAKRSEIPAAPDLSPYALKSELPADYLREGDITNFATRAWINSQGYATEGTVYARIDAQNLALGAATNEMWQAMKSGTNKLWEAHGAASNRLNMATNALWNAHRAEVSELRATDTALSNRLEQTKGMLDGAWREGTNKIWRANAAESNRIDAATNKLWQTARSESNRLDRTAAEIRGEISALELTGGMTRLWTSDAKKYQDATGVVWQVQVATSEWMVVHSGPGAESGADLQWWGPLWWEDAESSENWYGRGWYVCSSGLAPLLISEDELASEIVATYSVWTNTVDLAVTTRCTRTVQWLTNAVNRVAYTNELAGATNAVSEGMMNWVAETLDVWGEMGTVAFAHQLISEEPDEGDVMPKDVWGIARSATNYTDSVAAEFENGTRTVQYANNSGHADYAVYLHSDDASESYTATDLMRGATNAANAVAAPLRQDVSDLRTESSLVYRLYQGSNVVAEVTKYNSQVNAPELKIMQLNESNEYVTVWAETNGLARTLALAKEYADGATGAVVNASAPRAWSKVTAGMGVEAPSNTTWLSTGRTVIAGGLEFEKHLTSGGAIWLLESNGMAADFHAQTNNTAFIDLSNADGTPIFRVEKTDSFLVGVHVDSVTVDGNALVCGVGVVAAEHPLVRVRASLTSGDWSKEEDGTTSGNVTTISGLATVEWSGTTGNWTCRITNETGGNRLFAQMEYLQEGGTKIVNTAPLDVTPGILCTDGVHKVRPVYNNGNITWEVVP